MFLLLKVFCAFRVPPTDKIEKGLPKIYNMVCPDGPTMGSFGSQNHNWDPSPKHEISGSSLSGQKRHWSALWTALGPKGAGTGTPWASQMCLKHCRYGCFVKITTLSKKSPPGPSREAPQGGLVRTWEDLGVFWGPNGPPVFSHFGKKGAPERTPKNVGFW